MVVGEGAVDLAEDHVMMAGQPLDEHVEDRSRGAVAGIPPDSERLPRKAFEQAVRIGFPDVDFLGCAVALAPVAARGATPERLNLGPEDRAAFEQKLEAVVFGRVVASRHLDAAVDVEIMGCEIEHRRRAHAGEDDIDAPLGQPADERGLEHSRMGAAVASHRDPPSAFLSGERRI